MIRSRLALPSLPVLVVLGALVAITAFGITRWLVAPDATALPPLAVEADTAAAAAGAMDGSTLFAERVASVVAIEATIDKAPMIGAGVVVDTDGTIVTASHVVKNYEEAETASAVFVRFAAGDQVAARIVAIDQYNDLAILKIDPDAIDGLVASPLADNSDKVVVGSEVAAIGSPYGNEFSLTLGNVSSTHRVVDSRINSMWRIPDAIQFDASINQGNSGGPLFNARGEVIGIVQQIHSETKANAGVAFAVSANIVRRALTQARSKSEISYAWTGIGAVTMTPQLAAEHGIAAPHGALVQSVTGPAGRAGISAGTHEATNAGRVVRLGDVIVEVAGQPITSTQDLDRISGLLAADQSTKVVFVRGSERMSANLVTGTAAFTPQA